jgi:DNA-binding transcriptional regulator YhcF (GntR family)
MIGVGANRIGSRLFREMPTFRKAMNGIAKRLGIITYGTKIQPAYGYAANLVGKAGIRVFGEEYKNGVSRLSVQVRMENIRQARLWLELAMGRAGNSQIDAEILHVKEYASEAGVTLKKVGTTNKEIQKLQKQGYESQARSSLKLARERAVHQDVTSELQCLREFLSKAVIMLEKVGTSEKEIQELLMQGYESQTRLWLETARERADVKEVTSEMQSLREFRSKAGITLEKVGTSEKGIQEILLQGYKSEARFWLNRAKEKAHYSNVESEIKHIREYIKLAEGSLEAIGASEKTLQELLEQGNKFV